jgi:hypothetical protein
VVARRRLSRERLSALTNLAVDAVTRDAVAALKQRDIQALLLKGPVVADRLYLSRGAGRAYTDCDLLVAPGSFAAAEAAMAAIGLVRDVRSERDLPQWEQHAHTWRQVQYGVNVELHWTLMHVGVDPGALWEAMAREPLCMRVAGIEVLVPADPQLAVILALHAAQHGGDWSRPQEDLALAIEHLSPSTWRRATAVAGELGSLDAFAAGLRLLPAGESLAAELQLPSSRSFEVSLTSGAAGPGARAIERFVRAPGLLAKARVAADTILPSPARMRRTRAVARFGLPGLLLAYAWQPVRLTAMLWSAGRSWQEARRGG